MRPARATLTATHAMKDPDLRQCLTTLDFTTDEILKRLRRMETRHVKLMQHLGLDQDGKPTHGMTVTPTDSTQHKETLA